jgi:hypothetical protein
VPSSATRKAECRVVEGDDQVERRLPGAPGVRRAVLVQHHPRHRPSRPLAPVGAPARRLAHQPGRLQRQPGHRVAEPVAVALDELLVEMLDREVAVHLRVKRLRPRQLARVGPPRRRLADPPVDNPRRPRLPPPVAPAPERPLRHPQHLPGLRLRQRTALVPIQQPRDALAEGLVRLDGPGHLCEAFPGWLKLNLLAGVPRRRPLRPTASAA